MTTRRALLVFSSVAGLLLAGCDLATVGGEDETLDDGSRGAFGSPGAYVGKYWTTYYYLASQADYPGSGYPIYGSGCSVIVSSTYSFYKAAQMEGSARLNSGKVINWNGSCTCGGSSRSCFKVLGTSQPWGQGAAQNALIPLRSIAVDKSRIKLGSTIYIKEWDGKQIPSLDGIGGQVHDGCFRADDTGGAINGSHFDFFAGTKAMWKALESIYGTKTSFSLYKGGTKCAYVASLQPGDSGNSGNSGDPGDSGNSGDQGYGVCYYGGAQGTCQDDSLPCSGEYKGSLCLGSPSNIRCCMPAADPSDGSNGGDNSGGTTYGSCSYAGRTGTCQATSASCDGGYQSGLCPGSSSIQCCMPAWGSCSYNGDVGTCQLTTSTCSSGYKSGLCPGPNSVKCCLD